MLKFEKLKGDVPKKELRKTSGQKPILLKGREPHLDEDGLWAVRENSKQGPTAHVMPSHLGPIAELLHS